MDANKILQELVDAVDNNDSGPVQEIAASAEMYLNREQELTFSIPVDVLFRWSDSMESIIKPHVEYNPDQKKMMVDVIESNRKVAVTVIDEITSRMSK
jgi:hypothetical protein